MKSLDERINKLSGIQSPINIDLENNKIGQTKVFIINALYAHFSNLIIYNDKICIRIIKYSDSLLFYIFIKEGRFD